MVVIEVESGEKINVEVLPIEKSDFSRITKSRYFFSWRSEKKHEIFKLQLVESNDIIGLVSIDYIPDEWRIHVRLLTVSKENVGKQKKYENIIGNLLTYLGKIAIKEYGSLACVSLVTKTKIAQYYIERYGMNSTGITLSLELEGIFKLIEKYDHD